MLSPHPAPYSGLPSIGGFRGEAVPAVFHFINFMLKFSDFFKFWTRHENCIKVLPFSFCPCMLWTHFDSAHVLLIPIFVSSLIVQQKYLSSLCRYNVLWGYQKIWGKFSFFIIWDKMALDKLSSWASWTWTSWAGTSWLGANWHKTINIQFMTFEQTEVFLRFCNT